MNFVLAAMSSNEMAVLAMILILGGVILLAMLFVVGLFIYVAILEPVVQRIRSRNEDANS